MKMYDTFYLPATWHIKNNFHLAKVRTCSRTFVFYFFFDLESIISLAGWADCGRRLYIRLDF